MSNLAIQLSNYSFENNQIRTTIKDGEVWFIAKDVCDAVKISNVTDALIKLDEDEKSTIGLTESHSGMGAQRLSIVSESGMYTLVLRCRDAVKKGTTPYRFRKWVTSEILPSIRKTGSYSLTINEEQKYLIKKAVNERVYRTGEKHQTIYHKLYDQFRIKSYENLPASKFEDAIKFLGGVHVKSAQFTDDELCTLAWCYKAAERMRQHIKLVTDAMYQIKSEYAPSFYSMGVEYARTLEDARKLIDRETRHITIEKQGYLSNNWVNVLPNIRQTNQIQQF